MIVEPEDVDRGLEAVRAGVGVVAAGGDRPGRVLGVDDVAERFAKPGPFCSAISLPMLHMITLGWFRSRRTIACRSFACHSSKSRL